MARQKIFTKENWKKVPHIGETIKFAISEAKIAMREQEMKRYSRNTIIYKSVKPDVTAAAKQKVSERWIIVRRSDGRVWRGPFYQNGQSFTVVEDRWCVFGSQEEAERQGMSENFNFGWFAVQV